MENIILVDAHDNEIGVEEKLIAHEKGLLHRAFSIFVFNSKNELLLQQRARSKYHSGGLWTNTCCSHPRQGEEVIAAGHRRLSEELGFDCQLVEVGSFIYTAKLDKGLTEHEFDHVLVGKVDEIIPHVNHEEADQIAWVNPYQLADEINLNKEKYTAWLPQSLDIALQYIKKSTK